LSASVSVESSITIRGDHRRVARHLRYIGGNDDVRGCKLGPFGGVDIEADYPPSALDQVARDRASHDAKPDNSNGLVHDISSELIRTAKRCDGVLNN
jgi:hypothetical protein